MVDFSLKRDAMDALGQQAASVIVLDHHKTAEAELAPWRIGRHAPTVDLLQQLERVPGNLMQNRFEGCLPILAYFDMAKSGARMAWEFCHPGQDVPRLLRYVEDRDLWRKQFPETDAIHAALNSHAFDFHGWDRMAGNLLDLIHEGNALLRQNQRLIREMLTNAYMAPIGEYTVPVLNVPYQFASDVGAALLQAYPQAPFSATWFRRSDGKSQFSLRSEDRRVDVSEVARRFQGGGQRNAAGFVVAA